MKMYTQSPAGIIEVGPSSNLLERDVKTLLDCHLKDIFGFIFVASEFSLFTDEGEARIDTIAVDAKNSPVIIEYKRSENNSIVNQALYYSYWLKKNKAKLDSYVEHKFGIKNLNWPELKILLFARRYNKYDKHSILETNVNIQLYCFEVYQNGHITLSLYSKNNLNQRKPARKKTKYETNPFKSSSTSIAMLNYLLECISNNCGDDAIITRRDDRILIGAKEVAIIKPPRGKSSYISVELRAEPSEVPEVEAIRYKKTRFGFEIKINSDNKAVQVSEFVRLLLVRSATIP